MGFGFITLALGLGAIGVLMIDCWITPYLFWIMWGMCTAMTWIIANVYQTTEFWRGTCPRWIYLIFGRPTDRTKTYFSKGYMLFPTKYARGFALGYGLLLIIVALTTTKIAVISPITWLLCVCLSEWYFRRRYTKIKDWSKYPPE
jgi:hypothetical protein